MKARGIAFLLITCVTLFCCGNTMRGYTVDGPAEPRCFWLSDGYYSFSMAFSDGSELVWSGENQTNCEGDTRRTVLSAGVYCSDPSEPCMALEAWDAGWRP